MTPDDIQALTSIVNDISVIVVLLLVLRSEYRRTADLKSYYRSLTVSLIVALVIAVSDDERGKSIAQVFANVDTRADDS